MNKYITEFLGTFFLVLTIALTGNPLVIGVILMVMIYMGANISGGHYNPAVTLGVMVRGKIDKTEAMKYTIAQLIGAFAAAIVSLWFVGKAFSAAPAPGIDFLRAAAGEMLFTFALVSVVLNVATTKKSSRQFLFWFSHWFHRYGWRSCNGPNIRRCFQSCCCTQSSDIRCNARWKCIAVYSYVSR